VSEKLVVAVEVMALGLMVGHGHAMARPAAPFRLTRAQRAELRARLRQATVAPRLRVRLQAVQLRDQGQTVPQVAAQLAVSQTTVRRALRRARAGGLAALGDRPRCGRPPKLSDADLDAVQTLLHEAARQGRAWTARQLADWLAHTRGVTVSPGRLGAWLRRRGCRWTPTQPPG
jgi:transposase